MRSLHSIIKEYFPDENITGEFSAQISEEFTLNKLNSLISGSKNFDGSKYVYDQKPIPVIETNRRYYWDQRGFPVNQWKKILSNPFYVLFYLTIIVFNIYVLINLPLLFWLIAFIGYSILAFFILKGNLSMANIYTIDKSWITKQHQKDNTFLAEGTVPKEVGSLTPAGITILNFIKDTKNLSHIDRFLSLGSRVGSMWQTTYTGQFVFKYQK